MSEPNQAFNPYAADQMPEGGGLTRDIVVTSAKYIAEPMMSGGKPWIDPKTNQPGVFIGLRLIGLSLDPKAEGKEGKYDFSTGKKAKPSPDGEMLVDDQGNPAKVYQTSNLGKAINALRKGGFDVTTLYPRVSVLVGAKLTLAGRDQKRADGTPKTYVGTDGKTHNSIEWFPERYNGGAGSRSAAGNGAGKSADELATKAEAAVVAILAETGGKAERKDVIRALGTNLKGDVDAVKITALFARQDFHAGRPWVFDPATGVLTLEA